MFGWRLNIDDGLYVSSGDEEEDEDEVKEMVQNASKRMGHSRTREDLWMVQVLILVDM